MYIHASSEKSSWDFIGLEYIFFVITLDNVAQKKVCWGMQAATLDFYNICKEIDIVILQGHKVKH